MNDQRHVEAAEGFFSLGMHRDALLELTYVHQPDRLEVFDLKSLCYLALDRFREAEDFGLRSIACDEGNTAGNWEHLAQIAASACTAYCVRDGLPDDVKLHEACEAGAVYFRLGRMSLPTCPELAYRCARFLNFFARDDEALEHLRECLDLAPEYRERAVKAPGLAQLVKKL